MTLSKKAIVVIVLVFAVSTAYNVYQRLNYQDSTSNGLESTITAIEVQCNEEHKIRKQYKVRGEDELLLTKVLKRLVVSSLLVLERGQLRTEFENVLPRLEDIVGSIEILPLPDCDARGDRLRETLPE